MKPKDKNLKPVTGMSQCCGKILSSTENGKWVQMHRLVIQWIR